MVVLDTNIIIDHLRQYPHSKESILDKLVKEIPSREFALSAISVQELFTGLSTRDKLVAKWIWEIISEFKIVPYDEHIAQLAGVIERDFGPMEFPDAAIAATAVLNGAKLFTLNRKDFQGVKKLKLI